MEARRLRVALAQVNPTVGDLAGNAAKVIEWTERARAAGADIVAFPELVLTGYPPEDLILKPSFIRDNRRQLDRVAAATKGITAVVGFVDREADIFNAAAVLHDGAIAGVYHKVFLPNYGVFDEERYFARGRGCPIFVIGEVRIGISICEDCWYPAGPMAVQAQHGVELMVNINGSPYHAGKRGPREAMVQTRAADYNAFVAWVNTTGGQDELVFDGNSAVISPSGELIAHAASFVEELLVTDLDIARVLGHHLHEPRMRTEIEGAARLELEVVEVHLTAPVPTAAKAAVPASLTKPLDGPAEIYTALVQGTRDYVGKNGFKKVLVALSGGVDSALTAVIAADALGPANVIGVLMPSRYTSSESGEDAMQVAKALGIETMELSIEPAHRALEQTLAGVFEGSQPGIAEENIQPRIRGILLMAVSNKFGHLLLTTGNKSEIATGYCTLYGDMAGGFAVLKDLFKTTLYELCRYRNAAGDHPVIPERVLTKPPTAELKPGQKDSDSLPPYEVLDPILRGYIEEDLGPEDLVAAGNSPETVKRVIGLVDRSEYKRRQAPPGVKITPRAFGRDRRMPITNRYIPNGQQ